jgi:hypothetical protein
MSSRRQTPDAQPVNVKIHFFRFLLCFSRSRDLHGLGGNMFRILLAGTDSRLLATRAAVLSKTGGAVVYGNPMETLATLDSNETFELVVLCHTLEESDVAAIIDKVHQSICGAKILMVTSELDGYRANVNSKIDATTKAEPGHLVALAKEMLEVASLASHAGV